MLSKMLLKYIVLDSFDYLNDYEDYVTLVVSIIGFILLVPFSLIVDIFLIPLYIIALIIYLIKR